MNPHQVGYGKGAIAPRQEILTELVRESRKVNGCVAFHFRVAVSPGIEEVLADLSGSL